MMDFLSGVELTLEQATCIAQAMWQVAAVEEGVHAQEKEMIDAFFSGCAADAGAPNATFDHAAFDAGLARQVLTSPELKENFLRSCLLVGYADGHCSDAERAAIDAMAESLGISSADRQAADRSIQKELLAQFEGLDIFKDAVYDMGQQLGLERNQVDELLKS